MFTETMASQSPAEVPQRWGNVLGEGLAVYAVAGLAGFFGWGLLFVWVAGPEVLPNLPDRYPQLPAEAQALWSEGGFSLGLLLGAPCGIALLWRLAARRGPSAREYLGLKWPGLWQGLGWGLLSLVVSFGYWFLVDRLGLPRGGDHRFEEIVRIPSLFPLVILSLVVLGPILEELLMRGFLLKGLSHSRLGEIGAILITSALWAVMHPGGLVRWLGFFLCGALFALARLRTGSTYLTVLIHCISNLVVILWMVSE